MLKENVKKQYEGFCHLVYADGALNQREKELIAFACSVMINCKHCMEYHLDKALEVGASTDEINEAAAITMSIAAGKNRRIAQNIIATAEKK